MCNCNSYNTLIKILDIWISKNVNDLQTYTSTLARGISKLSLIVKILIDYKLY